MATDTEVIAPQQNETETHPSAANSEQTMTNAETVQQTSGEVDRKETKEGKEEEDPAEAAAAPPASITDIPRNSRLAVAATEELQQRSEDASRKDDTARATELPALKTSRLHLNLSP